ncbi:sigma-70 family RNA polymerase sigma factor [Bradyrhizobium japonicum]|uniref:sigma-70 family RNA polymerase sigma factor n=1 Tax=Bradyrhizobium japonicum TaxID=375 RepID=UPI0027154DEF|nr:sigma-70 family RNA polymerase sigma factor [Bradyrhizobium japonicum]WLB24471.1 sigma-70 family RNA polymerase sigma factor [Bradyrhizobium japonicum]
MEQAYVRYRPLLFSALSRLARHGFTALPHDSLDLIHDFFLEAWEPLTLNYDADKAKFETYLYAAFVRFVRPRIVRLHRWTDALLQPAEFAELDTPITRIEPAGTSLRDIQAIGRALATLAPFERELLRAYVADPGTSERDLAEKFSLTRYRMRLMLADALGKTAVQLGDRDTIDSDERAVANALWRDGRTVKEAARALARTPSDIQALRLRFFEKLAHAIKGGGTDPHPPRTDSHADPHTDPPLGRTHHMTEADHLSKAKHLLEAALKSSLRGSALDALQKHAEIVVAFLNHPASDEFFERHANALTPDALAGLYSALGSTEPVDPDDAALLEALLETSDQDEQRIGEAFAEVLIPNLPDDFTKFGERIFLGAPRVGKDKLKHLLSETSVIHGGPVAHELAEFGLTPVSIVEASQGIANLARRFCTEHDVKRYGTFILDRAGLTEGYSSQLVLSKERSVAEVQLMCELPAPTAERLFIWLARTAEYATLLFDGFDAELRGDELRLTRTDVPVTNLFARWHKPPDLIAA